MAKFEQNHPLQGLTMYICANNRQVCVAMWLVTKQICKCRCYTNMQMTIKNEEKHKTGSINIDRSTKTRRQTFHDNLNMDKLPTEPWPV